MTVGAPHRIVLAGLAAGLLLKWSVPAEATTLAQYETAKKAALQLTATGGLKATEEILLISLAYDEYKEQQKDAGVLVIGQPALSGQFPVSTLLPGTNGLLTFQFIDPATGLPTAGPTIGSVFYE